MHILSDPKLKTIKNSLQTQARYHLRIRRYKIHGYYAVIVAAVGFRQLSGSDAWVSARDDQTPQGWSDATEWEVVFVSANGLKSFSCGCVRD